jgi:superfamily II DNA/RNA helicase
MIESGVEPRKGLTFEDVWAALMEYREQLKEIGLYLKETDRQMKEQWAEDQKKREEDQKKREEDQKKREEDQKKWEEEQKKWEEDKKKWDENQKKWDEGQKKWDENQKKWDESQKKWDESQKKWNENQKKWDESNRRWGDLSSSIGDLTEVLIAARLWEKFEGYPYNLKRAYLNVQIFDDDAEQVGEIDILLSNTGWVMPVEVKRKLKAGDIEHHLRRMELIRRYPPAEAKGKRMAGAVAGGFVSKEARDAAFQAGLFVIELTGENAALCPPPAGWEPREWSQGSAD